MATAFLRARRAIPLFLIGLAVTSCAAVGPHAGGTGGAGGCVTAADCPGADTPCATRTCAADRCAVDLAPRGALAGAQTSGDCQQEVCDGHGRVTTIADDSDVPTGGDPCTENTCVSGQPSYPPRPQGTACGSGGQLACDGAGACLGCSADSDCGPASPCAIRLCYAGACSVSYVPSGQGDPGGQAVGDCHRLTCDGRGGAISLEDDTDVPDDSNPCTEDLCAGGIASHTFLPAGAGCGPSVVCDAAGTCLCSGASCAPSCHIGDAFYAAGAADPGDPCQVCSPGLAETAWSNGVDGALCDDGDACSFGDHCTAGVCAGKAHTCVPTSCQASSTCDGDGGCAVVARPGGTPCPDDGDPCTHDVCDGAGACAHPPVVCGPGMTCVNGTCV